MGAGSSSGKDPSSSEFLLLFAIQCLQNKYAENAAIKPDRDTVQLPQLPAIYPAARARRPLRVQNPIAPNSESRSIVMSIRHRTRTASREARSAPTLIRCRIKHISPQRPAAATRAFQRCFPEWGQLAAPEWGLRDSWK